MYVLAALLVTQTKTESILLLTEKFTILIDFYFLLRYACKLNITLTKVCHHTVCWDTTAKILL